MVSSPLLFLIAAMLPQNFSILHMLIINEWINEGKNEWKQTIGSPTQPYREGMALLWSLRRYFKTFKEPRNWFQGIDFASLCSLAVTIPSWFLAPIDCKSKFQSSGWLTRNTSYSIYIAKRKSTVCAPCSPITARRKNFARAAAFVLVRYYINASAIILLPCVHVCYRCSTTSLNLILIFIS